MIIYILVFIFSCLSCYLVQKFNNRKIITVFFSIIAIFIPSFIGGMRDLNIGTDVLVYGKNYFKLATIYSNFFRYSNAVNSMIGYVFINFIVSRFTKDVNIFLFIHQIIVNSLVYYTIYKNREKFPMWLAMLSYLTIYYCRTYNFLKQAIALSIVFYSFKYIEEKKVIKFIISIIIASTFHSTALVAIVLYFINYFINRKEKIMYTYIIIMIGMITTFGIKEIMEVLYNFNLLSERYYNYLAFAIKEEFYIDILETIFKLFFLILYLLFMKKINEKDKMNNFLGMSIILEFMFIQIRTIIEYADRIAFYFGYMGILLIPQMSNVLTKNKKIQKIYNFIVVILLIIYWYIKFVHYRACEVYPYSSKILGI